MPTILNIRPLLDAVKTRLAALLTAQTFTVKAGGTAAVGIHLYRLPNSSLVNQLDDLAPFAIVSPLGGSDSSRTGVTNVRIMAGIYNTGADGQGDADVERLAAAILRLSEEQAFAPHVLQDGIKFHFGDPETGGQNHPEYYLTVDLAFSREPVYLNQ